MTDDLKLNSLKVVLLSQLLVEAMDTIKGTELYKGKVKQHGNILLNVLNPMLKNQVTSIHNTNPGFTNNIFNNVDELVTKIAKFNVADITMLNQMADVYLKDPKLWQDYFELNFPEFQE